jgi:hypothetical protein
MERRVGRSRRRKESEKEKITLRGPDDVLMSMSEVQQGMLEAIANLRTQKSLRAKHVTIYAKLIDEDGKPVWLDPSGEWEITPYKTAAEELGV